MSGLLITASLIGEFAPFVALVPAGQFDLWDLPQGTPLPSAVGTRISRTEHQFLAAQSAWLVTERVQWTVRAANGEQRQAILKAVRDACRDRVGAIAGYAGVAVLLAGEGPDFKDADAAIYMGSTDLRVSFTEPA